ncbi:MAG TPA: hypothetical protein VMU51_35535, partial [Mycobacteriales bacterium]|nr:hypothetical protein [Mycobacteriales bacterium]
MSTVDDPGAPADFRILTPANWYVLDLNPTTRTASIARLVEQRFGPTDDPRLVQARRELTALLRGAARDAADNGAVYAALMDTLVDGAALSASLLAVIGPAPVDEDGNVVTDPAALSATLLAGELAGAVEAAIAGDGPDGPVAVDLTPDPPPAPASSTPPGTPAPGSLDGTPAAPGSPAGTAAPGSLDGTAGPGGTGGPAGPGGTGGP